MGRTKKPQDADLPVRHDRYPSERFNNNAEIWVPRTSNGIPIIAPAEWHPFSFVDFNAAKSCKTEREKKCVHFFIDDYRFEGLWNRIGKYAPFLKQFGAMLSPDFSMFTNWPVPVQKWNHYRKHFIAAYMQLYHGMTVYPTINWSDDSSFRWCFEGEPWHSTVCVSSVGVMKRRGIKDAFMRGYDAMLERLEPECIVFYGEVPLDARGNIVRVGAFQDRYTEVKQRVRD